MGPILNHSFKIGTEVISEELLEQYNKLLNFIESKLIINSIEETYKVIYSVGFSAMSVAKINNILMRLFDGDIENLNTLNMYMQNPSLNFPNKSTSNGQINARLKKLRDVYIEFTLAYASMLAEPFNLAGISSSIQKNSPNINVIMNRNDGQEFTLTANFNSLIAMVNQLTETLNNKLTAGNNTIDMQLINNYVEVLLKLENNIEDFKKKKLL